MSDSPRLRIALLAPPMEPVPPPAYAGTERVVAALVEELSARGHAVTLFASGDSTAPCELVPTVPAALWAAGYRSDVMPALERTIALAGAHADRFDIIHSHLDTVGLAFARACATPVVTTLHGRLDIDGLPRLLTSYPDVPLVAISANQRRWSPEANWVATIHHGLPLDRIPAGEGGTDLVLIGRATHEKGFAEAIELARRTGRHLRAAGKVKDPDEQAYFENVIRPSIADGTTVFLGEVGPVVRDALYGAGLATLMLGAWPEPFGLVAIESMAAGTPVIGRRAGALPELIEHGIDGFLVDDLREAEHAVSRIPTLDRRLIRSRALRRFSAAGMADRYEAVYRTIVAQRTGGAAPADPRPLSPVG